MIPPGDLVNNLGGSDDATTGRPTPNWWHDFSEKIKDASRPVAEQKMQHLALIELLPEDCAPAVPGVKCAITDMALQLNTPALFYSAVKNLIANHAFYKHFIKVDDEKREVGLTRTIYWRKPMGTSDMMRYARDMRELTAWADENEDKADFGQKCADQGEEADLCTHRWNTRSMYRPLGTDQRPLGNFPFEPYHVKFVFYDSIKKINTKNNALELNLYYIFQLDMLLKSLF